MPIYHPHIDGLRALAVLSVLVYHIEESLLPGGFVGVDIFFVISGFLITKLIVKEIDDTGKFSFKKFYLRRIRRLFPAMCATFILCYVAAYALLSPQHLAEFSTSTIYAILSISNFHFWNSAGYFDSVSNFKPLLHTWSLSVEEQFYFIWPLTLVLLYKYRSQMKVLSFIAIMGAVSLGLNAFVFNNQTLIGSWFEVENFRSTLDINATAFYLIPFRLYEFAIGAGLLFIKFERFEQKVTLPLFLIGLTLIIYSVFNFDGKMNFPSYAALAPCLGAALVIISGSKHIFAKILTNPLTVGVGLISYSLYLAHWPIIVFYKYSIFSQLTYIDYGVISTLSFLLAYLSYRFVEQPFRNPKVTTNSSISNKKFLIGSGISALLISIISINAYLSQGWAWRYPKDVLAQVTMTAQDYADLPSEGEALYEGDFAHNGKPKVLIMGDSMAADFVNAIVEGGSVKRLDVTSILIHSNCRSLLTLPDNSYREFFKGGAQVCRKEHQRVRRMKKLIAQADTVVLASYWWDARYQVFIDSTALYLKDLGVKNVMVLGMKVQNFEGVHLLASYPLRQLKTLRTPLNPTAAYHNNILRNFAKNYEYFDLVDQFCNEEGCRRATDDGYLIVFDSVHMTPQGAAFVGRNFENLDWFKKILDSVKDVPEQVKVTQQPES